MVQSHHRRDGWTYNSDRRSLGANQCDGGTITSPPVQEQIFNNGADGLNRFMGSLAVDGSGNMAVGYTVENAATHPDIRYAGRLAAMCLALCRKVK